MATIREIRMIAVDEAEEVEIKIDDNSTGGITLWVNVDGACLLRVISPRKLSVEAYGMRQDFGDH